MRATESTPEYESYRDDAVAIINGLAIMIAVMGVWTKPLFTGPIALAVAFIGFFLSPRSRGGTIIAVVVIGILAMLIRWQFNYALV